MAKRSRPLSETLLEGLTDPEEAAEYINAAYQDSDRAFHKAILNVARAHKIARVARKAGVTREHLHRTFAPRGNPTEATLKAVLKALGLRFSGVEALEPSEAAVPSASGLTALAHRPRATGVRHKATHAELRALGQLPLLFHSAGNTIAANSTMIGESTFSAESGKTANQASVGENPLWAKQGVPPSFMIPTLISLGVNEGAYADAI